MAIRRRSQFAYALLTMFTLATITHLAQQHSPADEQNSEKKQDDLLHQLMVRRKKAAEAEYEARALHFKSGQVSIESLLPAALRRLHASLALAESKADRIKILQEHVDIARRIEEIVNLKYDTGRVSVMEIKAAEYWRLDAEIQLLQAKNSD